MLTPGQFEIVAAGLAVLVAWLVACLLPPKFSAEQARLAGGLLLEAALIGLVAGRVGYFVHWWPEYFAQPISELAIGNRGFYWWTALPAVLIFIWCSRPTPALIGPMAVGVVAGALTWGFANATHELSQSAAPPLPAIQLATIDGRIVSPENFLGRPVVINLWSSACLACRRDLELLAEAEAKHHDITFAYVNQGESRGVVDAFAVREVQALAKRQVLLDPTRLAMRALHVQELPATLIFDAQGNLVDSYEGEMNPAWLRAGLRRLSTEVLLGAGA